MAFSSDYVLSSTAGIPVLGHREMLQEGKPAGGEALQGGDGVVVEMQLSEEHLVVQSGRLKDKQGEQGPTVRLD